MSALDWATGSDLADRSAADGTARFMTLAELSPPTPGQTGLRDLLDNYQTRIEVATAVHVAQFYDRALRQGEQLVAALITDTQHDVNGFLRALESQKLSALDKRIKTACDIQEGDWDDLFASRSVWVAAASWLVSTCIHIPK